MTELTQQRLLPLILLLLCYWGFGRCDTNWANGYFKQPNVYIRQCESGESDRLCSYAAYSITSKTHTNFTNIFGLSTSATAATLTGRISRKNIQIQGEKYYDATTNIVAAADSAGFWWARGCWPGCG